MCHYGTNRPWAVYRMGLSPTPMSSNSEGGRKVKSTPFEIAAKRLESDENVSSVRLITHFLAMK